jgi:hypothetical protein
MDTPLYISGTLHSSAAGFLTAPDSSTGHIGFRVVRDTQRRA